MTPFYLNFIKRKLGKIKIIELKIKRDYILTLLLVSPSYLNTALPSLSNPVTTLRMN